MTDQIERVARAIWLESTGEGWDDGSGVEKRMHHESGLLRSVADFYLQARAAIAAASEWQDISTAPKTGVKCLLWAAYENGGEAEQEFIGFYSPNIGWCIPAQMDNAPIPLAPTAWQPLPQPPKVTP